MNDETDEALLRRWSEGDTAAGDRLIRRHFGVVFRFFRAKIPSQVEDMTQRTFLACSEAASRFRGDGSFRAFLLAIARRQLFKEYRKQQRSRNVFDPMTVSAQDLGDPQWASLSSVLAHRQNEHLLLEALRTLPLDFQITLELYYWERLPIRDIATVLEIAPGTVKSRLGRARGMLRDEMEAMTSDPVRVESTMTNLESWATKARDGLDEA